MDKQAWLNVLPQLTLPVSLYIFENIDGLQNDHKCLVPANIMASTA